MHSSLNWLPLAELLLLSAMLAGVSSAVSKPWVIAHRGSSGDFPELTMLAFERAVAEGADMLELDTAVTRDHRVIVLHEPELSLTTDVQNRPEFASRLRTDRIYSEGGYERNVTDFFTWDLDLLEVKRLRKRQRMDFRDPNYNGKEDVPSLAEAVKLVKRLDSRRRAGERPVALLVEVKLCAYFTARTNRSTEALIAAELTAEGVADRPDLIHLQTFELACAAELKRRLPRLPVYKLEQSQGITDDSLTTWRQQLRLDGIGVHKAMLAAGGGSPSDILYSSKYYVTGATDLARRARKLADFKVLVWTLRNEDRYIAWNFSQDAVAEANFFIREVGVDGLITDFPKTIRRAVDECNGATLSSPSLAALIIAVLTVWTALIGLQS